MPRPSNRAYGRGHVQSPCYAYGQCNLFASNERAIIADWMNKTVHELQTINCRELITLNSELRWLARVAWDQFYFWQILTSCRMLTLMLSFLLLRAVCITTGLTCLDLQIRYTVEVTSNPLVMHTAKCDLFASNERAIIADWMNRTVHELQTINCRELITLNSELRWLARVAWDQFYYWQILTSCRMLTLMLPFLLLRAVCITKQFTRTARPLRSPCVLFLVQLHC